MHPGAFEFIGRYATTEEIRVIEIGSRDINGSVRCHFPGAKWTGLDRIAGPSVDVVCDACDYAPEVRAEMCICCEVLEHAANWRQIIEAAWRFLRPGGTLLVTCAGPGRVVHSGIDGGRLRPEEYYANIASADLSASLQRQGFSVHAIVDNFHTHDVYACAIKTEIPVIEPDI